VNKNKTPWPTKDVMSQIYEKHLWGGTNFDFYSGSGSHNPKIINPYIKAVREFLSSFKTPLTVCDLGCGDFNIGKHLFKHSKTYFAIDIVEALIKRNKAFYRNEYLNFLCLDISKDKLPNGDCVILRQVFQHLSNTEIKRILENIKTYKYLILTEHLPLGNFTPNKTIIASQGNRLKQNSGVVILKPPFNFIIKEEIVLNRYVFENTKSCITTTLFKI